MHKDYSMPNKFPVLEKLINIGNWYTLILHIELVKKLCGYINKQKQRLIKKVLD